MESNLLLIVDDLEMNRAILCELFQGSYETLEAENGEVALGFVERYGERISAILLDLVMPVMDGITVLRELQKRRWIQRIPVVLITAENSEDRLLQGYDLGVSDIVTKPFSPDIVRRRIQNVVELSRHRLRLEEMVHEQTAALERANVLLAEQSKKLLENNNFIVDALSTIVEFRNGESGSHIRRMRRITAVLLHALAERYDEYRMTLEQIDTIASAATMHDIGKIAIPDAVLMKPGRLTSEEFEIMKTHTTRGCELLRSLHYDPDDEYYAYCYEICRHHHERWDGRGYPDGLRGNEIPIWAQVVSIADVYEALTSMRVYKAAYSHEKAVRMIAGGECGQFNPALMRCFMEVAEELHQEVLAEE